MPREIKRTDIYETIFTHNGEPLSYDYFPYWRDVINSDRLTTNVPQLYRQQVWKCSRQVGKSVNIGNLAIGFCLEYPNITVVVTQPTDNQISNFSVQNIKPLETESIIVNHIYKDSKLTQSQVKNKSYITGSRIVMANIYSSVLSVRGIPGGVTFIDEYQSTDPHNAAIVLQGMRRSPVRISIRCGTPLEEENDLQVLFDESTGTEWAIKCRHCGHWNIDMGYSNMGKYGLMCEKCHRPINPRLGIWVDARPGKPIEGFHMNELCVPRDAPGATEWSKLLYEMEQDERTVQNEILGNSFSDNVHPITRKMIISACDPKRSYVKDVKQITAAMKRISFAGLDWAMEVSERPSQKALKSYTMLTIGHYNTGMGVIEIDFVRRYYERLFDNPDAVIKDIIYWLNAFNVKIIGMDYGVGHKENQRIAELIGWERCMEIEYTGEMAETVVYHRLSNKYCVSRTHVYDDTLDAFLNRGIYRFAKYAGETSEYESDLTTLYRYNDAQSRKSRYGKTAADDWWQNLVYIRLAYLAWAEKLYYIQRD